MKKALKIGIGILGIGYAVWTGFIVGGAMPLNTALTNGDTDWANDMSYDIIRVYGADSFVTRSILNGAMLSANMYNKFIGKTTRYCYELKH